MILKKQGEPAPLDLNIVILTNETISARYLCTPDTVHVDGSTSLSCEQVGDYGAWTKNPMICLREWFIYHIRTILKTSMMTIAAIKDLFWEKMNKMEEANLDLKNLTNSPQK